MYNVNAEISTFLFAVVDVQNQPGYKVLKATRAVLREFHEKGVTFCAGYWPTFQSHDFVRINVDLESEETPFHVLLAKLAALGQGMGCIHGVARQCSVRVE
jgi:hypothetical protein